MAEPTTVPDYTPSTAEDTPYNGQVIGEDLDGVPLTYALSTPPSHGVAVVNPDGTYTYTPEANWNGEDVFTVVVTDPSDDSTATSTITMTVTPVNDAPVNTVPGAQSVAEDAVLAFTGGRLISVADVDGNLASVRLTVLNGRLNVTLGGGATISAGANNSATLTLSGTQAQINAALATLTYQGNANYNGADTLTVLATDAAGTPLTDSDTVALTVTPVNDAPVNTVPGAQSVAEDAVLTFNAAKTISVADVDGNLSTVRLTVLNGRLNVSLAGGATISAGANNSATLTLSGSTVQINAALATLTYQGNANYNGADTLTVLSTDSNSATDSDTVTITVTAVNDAPTIQASYSVNTNEDTAYNGSVAAADVDTGQTLTYSKGSDPAHGAVVVNANGSYTYTPAANYNGADSFTISVSDGNGGSASTTVNVTVAAVADAPVVPNYTKTVAEDDTLSDAVVATDADAGASLMYSKGSDPTHGSVVVNPNGTYVYTPAANYNGPDSFTVVVSDGALSATSTINVTVTSVNDAPTAVADAKSTQQDVALVIPVAELLSNDSDPDGGTLSVASVQGAVNGTVALGGGNVTFTPTPDFYGLGSFTYTLSDGQGGSATATVTVNITRRIGPNISAIKTKLFNGDPLTFDEMLALREAALIKLAAAQAEYNTLAGEEVEKAVHLRQPETPAHVIEDMNDVKARLEALVRKTAEFKKELTPSQLTKLQELVTDLEL